MLSQFNRELQYSRLFMQKMRGVYDLVGGVSEDELTDCFAAGEEEFANQVSGSTSGWNV